MYAKQACVCVCVCSFKNKVEERHRKMCARMPCLSFIRATNGWIEINLLILWRPCACSIFMCVCVCIWYRNCIQSVFYTYAHTYAAIAWMHLNFISPNMDITFSDADDRKWKTKGENRIDVASAIVLPTMLLGF